MILEPLERFTIKVGGQLRELIPGQAIELSDAQATKLLAKAPDKVRMALSVLRGAEASSVGQCITWDSPVFGRLSAIVLDELEKGVRVSHPLTLREATIPKAWLRLNNDFEAKDFTKLNL